MGKKEEKRIIRPARREWDRVINKGVGNSFCKTLTEPITNSDSSYKRKLNIPMATGLVDEILKVPKGNQLDSSTIKPKLAKKELKRTIIIKIAISKKNGLKSRQCKIADNAEGISYENLSVFESYAGDKTAYSRGKPGRSLFGRGLSDVLLYHEKSAIFSVANDEVSSASNFDISSDGSLSYLTKVIGKATKNLRKKLSLAPEGNGTCVDFVVSKHCAIPMRDRMRTLLSNFYMLRLINADSNTDIKIIRHDSKGTEEYILEYDFPLGQVIGKIQTKMNYAFRSKKYQLDIDGIVVRAESDLKGPDGDIDARENGLLIVDAQDAVLDQTLLPNYEKVPYLRNVYGIIRIHGIRDLLFDHLEAGKETVDILTVNRDGFDLKQKFTMELFKILEKQLKPIYDREKELYEKSKGEEHRAEVKDVIKSALKPLNEFFNKETEEEGEGEDGGKKLDETKDIQFIPDETFLRVNREKTVALYIKSNKVVNGEVVLIGSNNEKIQVRPESITIDKKKQEKKGYFIYEIFLFCEELREKGNITAITTSASKGEDLTATCKITDVKGEVVIDPPEDMEFRPGKVVGLPNKKTSASLYINLQKIPIGRMIKINEIDIKGNIRLCVKSEKTTSAKVVVCPEHEIVKGSIAKVPVPFIGTGKGQHAKVVANTKAAGGGDVSAVLKIEIGEPKTEAGFMFEDSKYDDLDSPVNAMVADGIIWVNSRHPINKQVYGNSKTQFDEKVLNNYEAQLRYAETILDTAVFYTAQVKERKGGRKGLIIRYNMAVQDIQSFVDKHKFELAPKVYVAIIPDFKTKK